MNRSVRRVGLAVTVLFLVLVGQLTYLQVFAAERLADDPRNVRAMVRDYSRPRGEIVTSDGVVAARSVEVDDEFGRQREYPLGELFAHVVGYQSFVFGNVGVEAEYNDVLVGRDARLTLGDIGGLFSNREQTGTVVLSLSRGVQEIARAALGDQRGSVVAIEPQTGAVATMWSNPSFDPNPLAGHDSAAVQAAFDLLTADPANPALARAYRERYPPGSTFKIVTSAAGIDAGVTTPETPYPVLTELDLPQSDNTLQNFGGRSCGGTLFESFVRSCNTTFGQVGLDLGDRFVPGMARFGVGAGLVPPLDLRPGAVSSVGPPPGSFEQNQPLFAFAGIGQGDVFTTPLQMALAGAAVANGGVVMAPHVMAAIRDRDGNTVEQYRPRPWQTAMAPSTAASLTEMMVAVVERGTGTAARIPGVTVAGKSGTAQAPGGPPHAWFVAFAPAEQPRYVVAVIVERGGNAGDEATGGAVAAPIAAAVLKGLLGIPQ